ncbi:MAG: dihydroneopterin aldolase [Myxococcaceae bacterium]
MDHIQIRELSARCVIGVTPEERREKQEVLVSLTLSADLSRAGKSDAFTDTADYRAVKKRVLAVVEASDFHLLEALAEAIAAACLENPFFEKVKVTVDKPGALRFARSVGIEIVRKRH